jgi:Tfp pilus assembly protein PilN
MRSINLIPPEDRRGERAPLRAGPFAYVLVGALLLAFLASYLVVSTTNSISERKSEIADLEQQLATSEARAEALQSFTDFASLEQARTGTVWSLAGSRFDWERVMRELALVIPADISLNALSGSTAGGGDPESGAVAPTGGAEGSAIPTLTMAGCGTSHDSVARLLAALRDIDGVTRVGLTRSAEGGSGAAAATGAAPSAGAQGGCPDPNAAAFDITATFDGVAAAVAAGAVGTPPAEGAAPQPGDGSGVAEAQQSEEAARGSVESAQGRAREAVDRYIPGT